ncbi:MAG: SH3 domain-containing protein [Planctomycetes bacterium]|nr:SH3 domain-containing protein [Planctomycetota bacterium]
MSRAALWIWLLCACAGLTAQADERPIAATEALLERAATAWRDGHIEVAREALQEALADPHVARGPTLVNLGHCAFRLAAWAEAAWHYRHALRSMPGEVHAIANLRIAEERLGLDPDRTPPPAGAADAVSLTALLGAAALQAVGVALLLFARRSGTVRLTAALLLVAGVGRSVQLVARQVAPPHPQAVVLTDTLDLHTEPHRSMPPVTQLDAGTVVTVAEHSDRWARVTHERGTGWAPRGALGFLDDPR